MVVVCPLLIAAAVAGRLDATTQHALMHDDKLSATDALTTTVDGLKKQQQLAHKPREAVASAPPPIVGPKV